MTTPISNKSGRRRLRIRALSFFALALLVTTTHAASNKKQSWYRYESAHFVADSSASHKKTLTILTNLEMFRVAVYQAANLRAPETTPKTKVLIVRSRKEFRKIEPATGVGAFAAQYDGQFLIVMPASFASTWATRAIYHEYTHVLLGLTNFPFPQWYNEGFAELTSTIKFREKNTAFTFGEPPPDIRFASGDNFDWNAMISKGWDTRSMHPRKSFSAYMHSWLLAHFVMLGDDFENTPKLRRYFELIKAGQPSLPAFKKAFGMDGNELWIRRLRRYDRNLFALVFDFRADDLQTDFQRSESDEEAVALLIENLRDHLDGR